MRPPNWKLWTGAGMATWGDAAGHQRHQGTDFQNCQEDVQRQARQQQQVTGQPQPLQQIHECISSLERTVQCVQQTQQDIQQMQQGMSDRLSLMEQRLDRANTIIQQRIQNARAIGGTALLWSPNRDGKVPQQPPSNIREIMEVSPDALERVLLHYNLPISSNQEKMQRSIKMHIGVNCQ